MNGYVYLDKRILDWEWWDDVNTYRLFTYLILSANYKESKFMGAEIPRGSLAISLPKLSENISLTIRQTRTALEHLKSTGEVTVKRHAKFSIISVNNYDKYQTSDRRNDSQTTEDRHDERQSSDRGATGNRQHQKEYKESKKEKKYIKGDFHFSDDEILQAAFNDFLEMRNANKHPMTERAIEMLRTKLNNLSKDPKIQADILDQSVFHAWQDLYELKPDFVSIRNNDKEKPPDRNAGLQKRLPYPEGAPDDSEEMRLYDEDRARHKFDDGWRINDDGYWININGTI